MTDSDIAVDNNIGVQLQPGEINKGNDFVDNNKGKITCSVKDYHFNLTMTLVTGRLVRSLVPSRITTAIHLVW